MADFNTSFEVLMSNEGGFKLTKDPADPGGQTYAGISRRSHPNWSGWAAIDMGKVPPTDEVREFYRAEYWHAMLGDAITSQHTATCIFDYSVNAGSKTAIMLAQAVAGTLADGVMGPKTVEALNSIDETTFGALYTLAKIARYRDIVKRNPTQIKWFVGWINRALRVA